MRATARPSRVEELEPVMLPDWTLASWRRPATPADASTGSGSDASDGRWLWLLALLLLGVETWMRRERRAAATPAIARDRAA